MIYLYSNDNDTDILQVELVGESSYPVSVMAVSDPVTSENSNGFKAVVLDLIGDYEGVIVEYEYTNSNGYTSYVREIQLDYPWLCSAAIFLAVLWCTFRMGCAILCNR